MCSGRVDPIIVLQTLASVDGVLVLGCHPGDCHYIEGNYQAEHKMKMTKRLMEEASIDPERLRLDWVSASEGRRFTEIMWDFTDRVRVLGQNCIDQKNIEAAKSAASDFRLRALVGNELRITERGNVYDLRIEQSEFDRIMDDAIHSEYARHMIKNLLKRPKSVKEIANEVELPPKEVLNHIIVLKQRGAVILDHTDGSSPMYRTVASIRL
jgi:coenzyme F420-reducing hydrogenase delta subunit